MTTRHGQVSNAELLLRIERLEAELRRITGILSAAGSSPGPAGANADAWIGWAARRDAEAGQDRRDLGIDPPLYRTPSPGRNAP